MVSTTWGGKGENLTEGGTDMEIALLVGVFVLVVAALMVLRRPAKSADTDYYNEHHDSDPRDDWNKQGPGLW